MVKIENDLIRYKIKKVLKKLKLYKSTAPNWNKILSSHKKFYDNLKVQAKNGQKILICTSTGGHILCSHFEALLALALTRYGADVEIMLCDKALKGCHMMTSVSIAEDDYVNKGSKKLCNSCLDQGREAFEGLGLKINHYSNYLTSEDLNKINKIVESSDFSDILKYKEEGISIGEHVYAGALRYYAVGELVNEKHQKKILKNFFHGGLVTKKIFCNLFKNKKFDKIILNHAVYVPQGIICEVSKKFNLGIISYSTAYKKKNFIFSYDDTYHKTMIDEPIEDWIDYDLDHTKERKLFDYLESRKYGTQDMYYYFSKPEFKIDSHLNDLGVNIKKPILGLLTNIIWDAQIIYKDNIFKNMVDWLIYTINYLSSRNDIEVVVRCHPGEVNADRISKQKVKNTICERIYPLPKNLKIIDSDNKISTYSFAKICNTLIIYSSKMGMELAPFGHTIICAGEAYVKNKGITHDPINKSEYDLLLNKFPLIDKPNKVSIDKAKKYAYHYFFRRSFEIDSLISPKYNEWPPFTVSNNAFENLKLNKDNGLKKLSDCILQDKKFIIDK